MDIGASRFSPSRGSFRTGFFLGGKRPIFNVIGASASPIARRRRVKCPPAFRNQSLVGGLEDPQRGSLSLFRKGKGGVRDQKQSSKVHFERSRSSRRIEIRKSNRWEQHESSQIRRVDRSAHAGLLAITETPSPFPLPRGRRRGTRLRVFDFIRLAPASRELTIKRGIRAARRGGSVDC